MDQHHGEAGEIRRFGHVGPLYEVLRVPQPGPSGAMARIKLIESGEETDYPLAQLVNDPLAT